MMTKICNGLPLPPHFNRQRVGEVWRVPYQIRVQEAEQWAKQYNIQSASQDELKTCLILIDIQNTFSLFLKILRVVLIPIHLYQH